MQSGKIRIIGGQLRGRKIVVPNVDGVRPTTDRIRETVFNWLQPYMYNANCLDAFAGSGVLGIEAISRGAKAVTFVEQNKKVIGALQQTIESLSIDKAQILSGDPFRQLLKLNMPFDIVFLDPPFSSDLLAQSFKFLVKNDLLNKNALLYCEQAVNSELTPPEGFEQLQVKRYGDVEYSLWRML